MTRHQKLNDIIKFLSTSDGLPSRPEDICKKSGLTVDRMEAYLMLDMLYADKYVGRSMATNQNTGKESDPHYYILYKGIIFLDNGGYVLEHRHYKRQKLAQWISDYVDIVVKPIGIISAFLGSFWLAIQIYKFFACLP